MGCVRNGTGQETLRAQPVHPGGELADHSSGSAVENKPIERKARRNFNRLVFLLGKFGASCSACRSKLTLQCLVLLKQYFWETMGAVRAAVYGGMTPELANMWYDDFKRRMSTVTRQEVQDVTVSHWARPKERKEEIAMPLGVGCLKGKVQFT